MPGIAALGRRLYGCPFSANFPVLVVDADGQARSFIVLPTDVRKDSRNKTSWQDISALGKKLYCAPRFGGRILVVVIQTWSNVTYDVSFKFHTDILCSLSFPFMLILAC
eukprot:3065312-Amphidinium_carterae.1